MGVHESGNVLTDFSQVMQMLSILSECTLMPPLSAPNSEGDHQTDLDHDSDTTETYWNDQINIITQ